MKARLVKLVSFSLLVCCGLALGHSDGQPVAGASVAVAAADATADPADENVNTFFRSQDTMTTTDPSKEENIPGLAATDYRKVWRAIPNVEHFSPFITSAVPLLPSMKTMSLAMSWHFPMAWPLAGPAGEHKDWLSTTAMVYAKAMMGRGPRPLVYPTILIPTHEAYKKLAADMKQFSGLPDMATVHDPAQKALMAAAVYQQLMSNLIVVATPLLAKAENGTVMMTQGKVKLTLVVQPDGSRHLVSNTTTLRLKAMDLGCERCGPLTVQLVDSFVVPKMSPTPIKPDPIITNEDLQKMPANFKMMLEAYTRGPKAIWDMPGAVWGMAVRQLPDKHQEMLKKLPRIPQIPTLFSVDVKVRKPDQP